MPVEHVSLPTDFLLRMHLGGLVLEPFSLLPCDGVFRFVYASVCYAARVFLIFLWYVA